MRTRAARCAAAWAIVALFGGCGGDDEGVRFDVQVDVAEPDAPGPAGVAEDAPEPDVPVDADAGTRTDVDVEPDAPDAVADVPADADAPADVDAVGPDLPEIADGDAADTADAPDAPAPIPTGVDALRGWLRDGGYDGWAAEPAPHPSAAGQAHFGVVRAWTNDALAASLEAGDGPHPVGSAAVLELYGGGSAVVEGWAAMVKLQGDSAAGDGWLWFQEYQGTVFTAAPGAPDCASCHAVGDDFVQPVGPLE